MNLEVPGDTLAIRALDATTVELDLGCHCAITLKVDGSLATMDGPSQPCDLVTAGTPVSASATSLTVSLVGPDALKVDFVISGATLSLPSGEITCERITSHEPLNRVSAEAPACGPDETAVGVLPFSSDGTRPCYLSAGTESVLISLQQENDTVCVYESGSGGEGPWVLPQATRPPVGACVPRKADAPAKPLYNVLPFCRVDGRRFKPLTRDPRDTGNFYAVLNLGRGADGKPAPCAHGGTPIKLYMQNETDAGGGNTSAGRLGANEVLSTLEGRPVNGAVLHFCYFQAADPGEETMSEFPDLGFPYAVFHAFAGPQPSWVSLKRWVYSRDESRNNEDVAPSTGNLPAPETFAAVIETPTHGTTFNMARAR